MSTAVANKLLTEVQDKLVQLGCPLTDEQSAQMYHTAVVFVEKPQESLREIFEENCTRRFFR